MSRQHRRLSKLINCATRHSVRLVVIFSSIAAALSSGILNLKLSELSSIQVVGVIFTGESLINTILATLATIIAIYFSISILAVQYAASNYTASILEYYKKDANSWMTYLFLSAGLCLSACMLNRKTSLILLSSGQVISILNVGTVLLISSFLLLAFQFVHICDLVNPRTLILNAKDASISDIKKAPSRVASIQRRTKTYGLERIMPQEFFTQFVFHQNEATVMKVAHEKLVQIIDIVYKCAIKREAETYLTGLSAIAEMAESYVSIRKEDPTPEDKFLEDVYSKLLTVSKIAFDNKDTELLQHIIRTLERVGDSTTYITPISRISGPNQSTTLAIWHVHTLGLEAIQLGLWDGAAQSVRSIANIGIQAVKQAGDETLASNRILSLGKQAVAYHEWHVTNVALGALSGLLFQSVLAQSPIYGDPTDIMEAIEQLATLSLDKGLNEFALTYLFPLVFQNSLGKTACAALNVKNESHPAIETARREKYAKEIVSRLFECIDKIGLAASRNDKPIVLNNIFDCVAGIIDLLFREKFTAVKNGFTDELLEAIKVVSHSYIVRRRDVHPSFVWGGEDVLTKLAFMALNEGRNEISTACAKSILNVSIQRIELDKYGYDSGRLAGRIAVIGAYALHKSDKAIAQECANDLAEFDKQYMKSSPSPHVMLHIETMRAEYGEKADWMLGEEWRKLYCQIPEAELRNFELLFERARAKK